MRRMCIVLITTVLIGAVACGGAASSPAPPSAPATTFDGTALAEAAVAKLQADPFVAHVEQVADAKVLEATAQSLPNGSTITAEGSYDFNGDDLRALIRVSRSGGEATELEIVVLGEDVWVRTGVDGGFAKVPRSTAATSIDPLYKTIRLTDDPTVLRYVGLESIDGRQLQHLAALPGKVAYTAGTFDTLDLYVLDDGTPVLAKGSYTGKGEDGELGGGTTSLEFSNFGGAVTIGAPSTSP